MKLRIGSCALAVATLVALSLVPAEHATAQSFLINLDGLAAFPLGDSTGVRGISVAQRPAPLGPDLAVGYGVRAEVLYQIVPGFSGGLAVGLASHRSDVVIATTTVRGNLTAVPVHAIAEVHYQNADREYGVFGMAGAGFTDFSLRPDKVAASGTMSQTDFSFVIGSGGSYDINESWGLRFGLQYHHTVSTDGPLWSEGQNPKALYLTLGARFRQGNRGEN